MSIYEVHATSWKRHWDGSFWNWDELAADLIPYVVDLGFTHIELMPVMEHPLDMSWGYQPIGLHAPTARLGEPAGLKRFIDAAHQAEIGVLLDWVPAHFPKDAHGLAMFTGEPLYEHPDPRRGAHPDWGTAIYDFGRPEVLAFLVANALFWLREYHADGLRVDAVSSMIRLDYSRGEGEWAPFFGRSAYTMTLAGRLQQATGCIVLLAFARRLPDGRGFALLISPLDVELHGVGGTTRLNQAIESLVRTCPEQYLWSYNRYKTPAGAPAPPPTDAAPC
jgi:alpha-1,4-glucan:alpha-1,4-glucan 6-glycosyltransferase